jgi:outer membrane protein assembly factor BamB
MKAPLLLALTLVTPLQAQWAGWRGPQHNGISTEKISTDWPSDGPPVLWKSEVGIGFSGFAVSGNTAVTLGNADDVDIVKAFAADTGKELWKFEYDAELDPKYFEGGPTSSPTIHDGRVYILGKQGQLHSLDLATGKAHWSVDLAKETSARQPDWGFTGSPVVVGSSLLLNVGSHGTSVNLADGKVLWKSKEEPAAGYTTPLALADGTYTFSNSDEYFALDPKTGSTKWTHPWATRYGVNAADPIIVSPTELIIASGYNKGSTRIDISSSNPTTVWQNRNLRSQMNPALLIDGHLYGVDGDESSRPAVNCVDAASGDVKWTEKSVGAATLIAADNGRHILLLSDKGELHLVKPSPSGFESEASAQVLTGKCWTAPVLSDGRLFLRNAAGKVSVLSLKP